MPARTMSASRTSSIGAVAAAVVVLSTSAANAVCYSPQQALPAQTISQFAANPNQLLQQYPNGGGLMISQIRDLAASDNSMLGVIMGLLTNASPSQKTAIATGLAQAARTCMRVDSQYANSIAQAIANTKDEELIMAYTAVTGEQPTGGVGGGQGLAGGAVGGQTNPLPGNTSSTGGAALIPGSAFPTGQFSISSSVTGIGGPSGTTSTSTTTITTITTSVSSP